MSNYLTKGILLPKTEMVTISCNLLKTHTDGVDNMARKLIFEIMCVFIIRTLLSYDLILLVANCFAKLTKDFERTCQDFSVREATCEFAKSNLSNYLHCSWKGSNVTSYLFQNPISASHKLNGSFCPVAG